MPCPQCARNAKFCMLANTQILVLALSHKFVVPYLGFQSFLCIWDVPYFTCHPFSPIFCHFEPLQLGIWTLNPRFVVWPLELGIWTLNLCCAVWPLELGIWTLNPRSFVWLQLQLYNIVQPQCRPRKTQT